MHISAFFFLSSKQTIMPNKQLTNQTWNLWIQVSVKIKIRGNTYHHHQMLGGRRGWGEGRNQPSRGPGPAGGVCVLEPWGGREPSETRSIWQPHFGQPQPWNPRTIKAEGWESARCRPEGKSGESTSMLVGWVPLLPVPSSPASP